MNNIFPDRKELNKIKYESSLVEQAQNIDIDKIDFDGSDFVPRSEITEKQKVFFWIRLYLKDESKKIQPNDNIIITHVVSKEKLPTKFICFAKKGAEKDNEGVVNYNSEDDTKVLCLMVDSDKINNDSEDIPFIRTLFRIGDYYQYNLLRRDELIFTNERTKEKLEYFDCDF